MPTLNFKNLNVASMLTFLNNADVDQMQIIEFKKDLIVSKGHPPTKVFVKYAAAPTDAILEFTNFPEEQEILKFPVYRLSKFISTLKVYQNAGFDKLTGNIDYKSNGMELIGEKITINTEKSEMKTVVQRTDMAAVSFLSDDKWNSIASTEDFVVKFDITKDFTNRIKSLMGISYEDGSNSKKDESFVLEIKDSTVIFSSGKDAWNSVLPPSNIQSSINTKFDISSKILEWLTTPMQTVYIVKNQHVPDKFNFIVYENAMSIFINIISEHNPNIYK